MKQKNIVFIGFMGVGKGTLSRELSNKIKLVAIDTDDIIESMENTSISNIFKEQGEVYFRALEQRVANWLSKSVKNTIVSTGGGFVYVKNIKDIGKIIYLKSTFKYIKKRILNSQNATKKIAKRPLWRDIKSAKRLFEVRKKTYERVADKIISIEGRETADIIKEIEAFYKK